MSYRYTCQGMYTLWQTQVHFCIMCKVASEDTRNTSVPWYLLFQLSTVLRILGTPFKMVGKIKKIARNSCSYWCTVAFWGLQADIHDSSWSHKASPFTYCHPRMYHRPHCNILGWYWVKGGTSHNQEGAAGNLEDSHSLQNAVVLLCTGKKNFLAFSFTFLIFLNGTPSIRR